jgi:hypothetical protein
LRPERNRSGFGRRRTLRDGLLMLVSTFYHNAREQNKTGGSSKPNA